MANNLLLIMPPASGQGQPLTIMSQNQLIPVMSNIQNHQQPFQQQQHQQQASVNMQPFYTFKTTKSPPLKPAKKFRLEPEDIQRTKRRIHFGQLNTVLQRSRSNSQLRRNERERNRVRMINMTFARLRQHIPDGYCKNKNKKLSKVDTLRGAIDYIHGLKDLIDENDAINTVFDGSLTNSDNNNTSSLSASSSALSSSSMNNSSSSAFSASDDKENMSVADLSDGSHSPGTQSDHTDENECPDPLHGAGGGGDADVDWIRDAADASLSPDEEDLLDFDSWFQ